MTTSMIPDRDNEFSVLLRAGYIHTAATELTIASGVITITKGAHTVDTESDAASDDLDTINGAPAEMFFFLRPASGARTVVLKHGTGNIISPTGLDITLDDATDVAMLYSDGTNVLIVGATTATGISAANVLIALAANTSAVDFNSQALTGVKSITRKASTTLTIATGVVTATQSIHAIDTEAAAASDDLDTISGMVLGNWYRFKQVAAARNVVFKHGTGNLLCWGNRDVTLDVVADSVLVYYDGTNGQVFPAGLATAPQTGTPSATSAPAFTGTTPTAAFNPTALFSGTGQSSAGQVITTTDNQTMTLNQCAGMLFISATHGPYYIASNTAVAGAPAVLTIYGTAPTTDAGTYKIINGLAPVGTVSAVPTATHTHNA